MSEAEIGQGNATMEQQTLLAQNQQQNSQHQLNTYPPLINQSRSQPEQQPPHFDSQSHSHPEPHSHPAPPAPSLLSQQTEHYFNLFLDYVLIIVYSIKLLAYGTLSSFATFWIIYYMFHIFVIGPFTPVNRVFVFIISAWLVLVLLYNKFNFDAIGTDQRIFLILYFVQALPSLVQCCLACGIICCTCACATCCFCFCLISAVKQYYDEYMNRAKFKRVREELCLRNLREVEDIECPICLETGGQMNTQQCHHSFHQNCLQNWLKAHKTCPLCRVSLY